jgi:hypothetical protein
VTGKSGVTPCTEVATGDRVMCRYVGDTPLDVFTVHTVEYVIEDASGTYLALEDIQGAWARWRFEKVIGGQ